MDYANTFSPFSSNWGAVAFWTFIAAVSVAGTVTGYLSNRETQKTIRQAMESGAKLDEATLDRLLGRNAVTPAGRIFNGLVTMAAGLGVIGISIFLGLDDGRPVWVITGAGILVMLVGGAIFGFGRWSARQEKIAQGK